jgi:Ca2+-binding RTX toxin-like protein
MVGGGGNDTYYVDAVGDKVFEYPINSQIDLVISSISYVLGAYVENLQHAGTANLNGTGNTLDNRIIANRVNNVLTGQDGIDTQSYETQTLVTVGPTPARRNRWQWHHRVSNRTSSAVPPDDLKGSTGAEGGLVPTP